MNRADEERHNKEQNTQDIMSMIKNSEDSDRLSEDVFWYIIDNDQLHKQFFIPLARTAYIKIHNNTFSKKEFCDSFMSMVKKGCISYYNDQNLMGHPKNIFSKLMRKSLCQRLADYTYDDIAKGEYNLGDAQELNKKNKKINEIGASQMAPASGPIYDTSGNNSLSESVEDLDKLLKLAGLPKNSSVGQGSNISLTAYEKSKLMKEHNIQPGTAEWFRLWFSRPYLTNVNPLDPKFKKS